MKRYLTYVNEYHVDPDMSNITKIVNTYQLKNYIKDYCNGFRPENAIFFRGQEDVPYSISIIKPSLRTRASQFGTEFSMALLDGWFDYGYPRRSKSLPFTVDEDDAANFGNGQVYYVIPFNGNNIGVSMYSDFNYKQFKGVGKSIGMNDLNNFIKLVLDSNDKLIKKDKIPYEELVQSLEMCNPWDTFNQVEPKIGDPSSFLKQELIDGYKKYGSFLKYFEELTKPNKKDFFHFTMDWNNIPEIGEGSELWTDGGCILVKKEIFETLYGAWKVHL